MICTFQYRNCQTTSNWGIRTELFLSKPRLTNTSAEKQGSEGVQIFEFTQSWEPRLSIGIEVSGLVSGQMWEFRQPNIRNEPYNSEGERWIDMDEQGCDLVLVVEDKTISPCYYGTSKRSVGKTITGDEESGA